MPIIKKNLLLRLLNLIGKKDDAVLRLSVITIFAAFGFIKFFEFEVRALEPLILNTWLEFFHYFLGLHGTSYFFGVVEVLTVFLLFAGFKRPTYGVAGAGLVIVTGMVTLSLMPQMKTFDAFIFKDILLIGIGLTLVKRDLLRLSVTRP